jgi:hypothetical protein
MNKRIVVAAVSLMALLSTAPPVFAQGTHEFFGPVMPIEFGSEGERHWMAYGYSGSWIPPLAWEKVSRRLPTIITLEAPRDLAMPRSRSEYLHVMSMRRLGAKTPNKQQDRTNMLEHAATRLSVTRIGKAMRRRDFNRGIAGSAVPWPLAAGPPAG